MSVWLAVAFGIMAATARLLAAYPYEISGPLSQGAGVCVASVVAWPIFPKSERNWVRLLVTIAVAGIATWIRIR